MESFSLFNACNSTAAYLLPLDAQSREAENRDSAYANWDLHDGEPYLDHYALAYTRVKSHAKLQPSWPLLTLPLKRSIHNLAAKNFHDVGEIPIVPTSSFDGVKRMTEATTLPSLDHQLSQKTTTQLGILESSPEPITTGGRLFDSTLNDDIGSSDFSKPLLSPIRFTPPGELKVPDLAPSGPDERTNEPSAYRFFPPTNPADKIPSGFDLHRDVPRRRLFYDEPTSTPTSKSLHRATGSHELRRKAGRETEDDKFDTWLKENVKASAIRPYFSEPARSKPRLWLDLAEEGEKIEEAHATTVTSSPTKPQLISIPRRRATTTTAPSTPSSHHEQMIPNFFPSTPPDTPATPLGLGIDSLEPSKKEKERLAFEKIKARPTWTSTPPAFTISTPDSAETLRLIPHPKFPKPRPDTPRPSLSPAPQLSELTTWMLTELEHCICGQLPGNLQLSSPVIQQLRLPPAQRRVPRYPPLPPTLPMSQYSTYSPLSSHPPTTPPPTANPQSGSMSSVTLLALRTIFPQASLPLLDTLQAAILALHHVSSIYLPSSTSLSQSSRSPSRNTPNSYSLSSSQGIPLDFSDISYIPSKARAMLGLSPSTTARPVRPTLPNSWLRPQIMSWGKRVEELELGLGTEVGRLVRECLASDGQGKSEGQRNGEGALVRAVSEVVRLGEGL